MSTASRGEAGTRSDKIKVQGRKHGGCTVRALVASSELDPRCMETEEVHPFKVAEFNED